MPDELIKNPGEVTPEGDGSPEEKKQNPEVEDTTPKNEEGEGEEKVEVSKKELELLEKDSKDLHGIFDARRKKKLAGLNNDDDDLGAPAPDEDAVGKLPSEFEERLAMLEKEQEEIKKRNKEIFIANLDNAYKRIKKAHPWATTDENIEALSKNVHYADAITEDQIYAKLEGAIRNTFPKQYEKSIEENIKKKVLEESNLINAGDIAGGSGAPLGAIEVEDAKLKATQERLSRDLPPGFSAKKA
jgi:hypothetical protein